VICNNEKKQFEVICPGSTEECSNGATGRRRVCHGTVVPGQSQENLPNLLGAHNYSAGGCWIVTYSRFYYRNIHFMKKRLKAKRLLRAN
jgi:hypothetical protein